MPFQTVQELTSRLSDKTVSSLELTNAAIDRIEKGDGEINAVVVRDFERAREEAAKADAARAEGDDRPLLGVPMTVKESFDVRGLPTTWGIEEAKNNIAQRDAITVERLKSAGAVILGKTNVPYLLIDWQSDNEVYGRTVNPWDHGRSPGGSSGGGSAALAAGFVPLELGSDIGGSLRFPASFCGIYSLKPTWNLIPGRGHKHPLDKFLSIAPRVDFTVVGPMARTAEDLMTALDVLAGPDEGKAVAYKLDLPDPRYNSLKDYRVLVLDDHPLIPTSGEVRGCVNEVAAKLEQVGCKVGRKSELLPDLESVGKTYLKMLMSIFSASLPELIYGDLVKKAGDLSDDDQDLAAMVLRGSTLSHRDWILADRYRTLVIHQFHQFFKEWDVIFCPVSPTVAFPHNVGGFSDRVLEVDGEEMPYNHQSMWISIATLPGNPATTLPIGFNKDGMPIGAQIVGPNLEDKTTIGFAQLLEQEIGGFQAPPGF